MAEYKVNQDYRAVYAGQVISFTKGHTSEVEDDQAEWVNRDSPGTLTPVKTKTKAEPEPEPEDEFKCETCGKVAKTAAGLAAHERSHEGD